MKNKIIYLILCCLVNTFSFAQNVPQPPGIIINHVSKETGKYIGSPSICILPDGSYLASHDEFGPKSSYATMAVTKIFRSRDKGKTWNEIATIKGVGWSTLFVHNNGLYNIGTSRESGNFVLRKSTDGGITWTNPYNKENGLILEGEYHTSPMPLLIHNGRIWRTVEYSTAPSAKWGERFSAMVISAPVNADLLNANNWTRSNHLMYQPAYLEGRFGGWLEGNPVVAPDGRMLNILRVDTRNLKGMDEYAAFVGISKNGKKAAFNPEIDFAKFPGGCKKFEIRYDAQTKLYWTMSNAVAPQYKDINPDERTRNVLVLSTSKDLKTWQMHKVLLHHPDVKNHGFQYPSFLFEGEDIIFVSRTAFDDESGGADNCHNANFFTFHRILNFRDLVQRKVDFNLLSQK